MVGLRPTRTSVRVEKEKIGQLKVTSKYNFNWNKVGYFVVLKNQVVHNYGHCGWGVMTSPGSALTAAKLVREALDDNMDNAHLNTASKL